MFTNKNSLSEEKIKSLQFIVVYDKISKPAAMSLYNKVNKKYKSIAWSEKEYKANEVKCTNHNKRLFLVDSIIDENLQDPTIVPKTILEGAILKTQGPMAGIKIENEGKLAILPEKKWDDYFENKIQNKLKEIGKEITKEHLIIASLHYVLSCTLASPLYALYLFIHKLSKQKKAKLRYYFVAVNIIIKEGMLEAFMNDN